MERFAGLCNALEKLKTQNSKLVAEPNDGNLMCVKIIVPSPHFNKPFFQLGRWRALKNGKVVDNDDALVKGEHRFVGKSGCMDTQN